MEVIRHTKGAVEPFLENKMSDAKRTDNWITEFCLDFCNR
jgi:hypothetical protein